MATPWTRRSTYREGSSGEIVGQLLKGRRDGFVVSSKYTLSRNPTDPNAAGNARKNLRTSLETSLRRPGTDYVDLYWVHMWDRVTPVEEMMRALDDAVRAGKILYVGISDAPAWVASRANTLAELRGWSPFIGLQVPYSLLQRDPERELLPMAEGVGTGRRRMEPARPVLTVKYGPKPGGAAGSRHSGRTLSTREHAVAQAVRSAADQLGVTPAQVAIAWTRRHSVGVHPIVGARRVEQLDDNLAALDLALPDSVANDLERMGPGSFPAFRRTFSLRSFRRTSARPMWRGRVLWAHGCESS